MSELHFLGQCADSREIPAYSFILGMMPSPSFQPLSLRLLEKGIFLYLKCISEVKLNQSTHYTRKPNSKGKMLLRQKKG